MLEKRLDPYAECESRYLPFKVSPLSYAEREKIQDGVLAMLLTLLVLITRPLHFFASLQRAPVLYDKHHS